MAFDHYLPASYIGSFSRDANPTRRKRRLWAVDKREGRLFETTASELCGAHNFYGLSLSNDDPRFVDSQWSSYESDLNAALERMVAGTIDAVQWLKTLVVFVAALLVRGEDFETRFTERLGELAASRGRDNTNMMRLMELQRLFASVIGARWLLLETPGTAAQITNDLGYTPFLNPAHKESGIAIPLNPRHILLIITTLKRVIARAKDGGWEPNIERGVLDQNAHGSFLKNIAASAQRYVMGPDEESLRQYVTVEASPPAVAEPALLGFFSGAMARHYEMIYFHLSNKFSSPPANPNEYAYVDYAKNMPGGS